VEQIRQDLSKSYAEGTRTTGMVLISVNILDPRQKLGLFWSWDKGIDIDPEDETSYTTQYQESFVKYVESEYPANHQCVRINEHETVPSSNPVPSATSSGSC